MPKSSFDLASKTIIISRTDSIGDVVLTLPMAGIIKAKYPDCRIIFLGRNYTRDVVALSKHVDQFASWDSTDTKENLIADVIIHVFPVKEIATWAKQKKIPLRVGTTNRIFHWHTCNRLIRLSRKNSPLHESLLNIKLLSFCDIKTELPLYKVHKFYGFTEISGLSPEWAEMIDSSKINVILHPKSKGSAREWGLQNFAELIRIMPPSKYKIFISGTSEEGKLIKSLIDEFKHVVDLTGKMSLREFISFIRAADVLLAASTGPLHIAAAIGKYAIGLYAPMRPIHPGRWMPLGINAQFLVVNRDCSDCRKSMDCHCIREIKPYQVLEILNTVPPTSHLDKSV